MRRSKLLLLSSVSLMAITIGRPALATTFGGLTGQVAMSSGAPAGTGGTPLPGGIVTPGQAAQNTMQSTQDFSAALAAINAQMSAQAAARAAAQGATSSVPNGLTPGGLVPYPGAGADPATADASVQAQGLVWENANTPTQATESGETTVTIEQTAQKAILTWQTFNVGKDTTVHFDQTAGTQSDGSNTWIALNRVEDPSANPTQILGTINAEGSVYIINRNGIMFGGSSQVNVHSLVASTLPIFSQDGVNDTLTYSNDTFLNYGIDDVTQPNGQATFGGKWDSANPFGDVTIEAGAEIDTGDTGFSLITGTNVTNDGTISADNGQIVLAAGVGLKILPSTAATSNNGGFLTVSLVGKGTVTSSNGVVISDTTPESAVVNNGLIYSTRGNATLLGYSITQASAPVTLADGSSITLDGTIVATTSISRQGTLTLKAADEASVYNYTTFNRSGPVTLQAGTVTAILPDEDGETTTSSAAADAAFTPGVMTLTGREVTLQNGSLIEAPGALVTIGAYGGQGGLDDTGIAGRVYLDDGAIIDVAGLADVELAMSANGVTISRVGANELADSPLQQDGFLYGQSVTVDSRDSGTRADGLSWVGSPLINAQSYVDLVPREINQLLIDAGSIDLAGSEVITHTGSILNLQGGYIHYLGGMVPVSMFLGADGNIYSAANADPNVPIVGFAGQTTVYHSRWVQTDTYTNMLDGGSAYESDYIEGGDAGHLTIFAGIDHSVTKPGANGTAILDGTILARAYAGRYQVADGDIPTSGLFQIGNVNADTAQGTTGTTLLSVVSAPELAATGSPLSATTSYAITADGVDLDSLVSGFDATTAISTLPSMTAMAVDDPDNLLYTTNLSASVLNDAGFGSILLAGKGDLITVAAGTGLSVAPGGSITMKAGRIEVYGDLTAPSGSINLATDGLTTDMLGALQGDASNLYSFVAGDIVIGPDANLNARGQWVNDAWRGEDEITGSAFIDGGSISLRTQESSVVTAAYVNSTTPETFVDNTGSIILDSGSVLDVSSGGYVKPDGTLLSKDGIVQGEGGSIALITYDITGGHYSNTNGDTIPGDRTYSGGPYTDMILPQNGQIVMDGTLMGYGFSGGGTLSLKAPAIQIGGDAASAPDYTLYLPADFFDGQGFGAYNLTSLYSTTVAQNVTVTPRESNLLPDYTALSTMPSGGDVYAASTIGMLDDYHRQPVDFSLASGEYLNWNLSYDSTQQTYPSPNYPGVNGTLLIDDGAAIDADAGAAVSLASLDQITVLGAITAHGGSIAITGTPTTVDMGSYPGSLANALSRSRSIWLGADSLLDVSGVSLLDPSAKPVLTQNGLAAPRTGKVLEGGSVSLLDDFGYVIAEQGATIDVSGASDIYDLPQNAGNALAQVLYAPTSVWSDAGSITLGATAGLMFDGTIAAHGGAPEARGGTLTIDAIATTVSNHKELGATSILIQQSGSFVPDGLVPGDIVESNLSAQSGIIHFAADTLDGSGIDNLTLDGLAQTGGYPQWPVPVAFAGDVNIDLAGAFIADARNFIALPDGATAVPTLANHQYSTGAGTVDISAAYVNLAGYSNSSSGSFSPVFAAGDGTLNIDADTIDLTGSFGLQNFANANFTASGDIRLYTPTLYSYNTSTATLNPGEMVTAGNLTFKAADIYPATASTYVIVANANGITDTNNNPLTTSVTILPNGTSSVPLSAGGTLLIDANVIDQEGTLRAPSGSIVLGVTDTASQQSQFNNVPLTATQSVVLADGSLTSVSLDGATIPYGTTVDGVEWQYDVTRPGYASYTGPDLAAPPAKSVTINGATVALNDGANIDVSGGGDLQAAEWVPGTGGSRDVLAQYNTSYATGSAVSAPLYADGRPVYAVIPGYSGPAPYDAEFSDQPAVGQSVYLSGIAGLPAGVYTLLPAQYATLPGAYRVVQNTGSVDAVSAANTTLPDGTNIVAGYFVNGLTGAQDSRSTSFTVQSRDVWRQYSEYTLTSANDFFPAQAGNDGDATPRIPVDAGRLSIAAINSLSLGASIDTDPADGARGGQIDIASQAIQIVADMAEAQSGYLVLTADDLSALGASSLLIGGQRSDTASGQYVTVQSSSVLVDTDADHPLSAPEIILAAKNDVTVDSGSVIAATGSIDASSDVPLTIGRFATTTSPILPAVSGDGALLRVSNGAPIVVNRVNVTGLDGPAGTAGGTLTIAAGADIQGGKSLTLDATGSTAMDKAATISGSTIDVDSNEIAFVAPDSLATPTGLVIGADTLAQLANADTIGLHSRSTMDFYGDVSVDLANDLTLSAGTFTSDGGNVTIDAPKVAFLNDLNASGPASADGGGTLAVNAAEVDFGTGDKTLSGFGEVNVTATGGIVGQGKGSFDFGDLGVTLTAPVLIADQLAQTTLKTTGFLTVNAGAGTALTETPLGGAITLIGGTLDENAGIQANGGTVNLEATSGDLTLGDGTVIAVNGIGKDFYDVTKYASGGAITLKADNGNVVVPTTATLDFSAAAGGGDAGSLTVTAPTQTAQLNGTLLGGAANGTGGSFTLDVGGAVDLDTLAGVLAASGIDNAITVHTRAGNLTLSSANSLVAENVELVADGGSSPSDADNGHVAIAGTIDASGSAGGTIGLYGKGGVDVEGSLIATGSASDERGGNVTLATVGNPDGTLNAVYGYENVQGPDSGTITVGSNAVIDVSGGTAGGLSGGTLEIRAPLLANGDVNVDIANGATITGARDVGLEAYAVWSTTDASTGGQHFDGIVDPAGWYDAGGNLVAGTWTDQNGDPVAAPTPDQLADYLTKYYFTPTTANADHETFYGYTNGDAAQGPGTIMGFVEAPGFTFESRFKNRWFDANGNDVFHARPGVELRNPSSSINNGNISVLTNWNLGAIDGSGNLVFRYGNIAPIISIRAANGLDVEASITDGFVQTGNPVSTAAPSLDYNTAYANFGSTASNVSYDFPLYDANYNPLPDDPATHVQAPATGSDLGLSGENPSNSYYSLYQQYLDTYQQEYVWNGLDWINYGYDPGGPVLSAVAPAPVSNIADYAAYLSSYNDYIDNYTQQILAGYRSGQYAFATLPTPPAPPPAVSYTPPVTVANGPSIVATADNPLALLSENLAPEASTSSYRMVAGSDFLGAAVLATRTDGGVEGSFRVDGHTIATDPKSGSTIVSPTIIRTGTGSIDIAAAGDVALLDTVAPGVIYTAGTPDPNAPATDTVTTIASSATSYSTPLMPEMLIGGLVSPTAAGDISISAGNDILGVQDIYDTTGALTGTAGTYIGQSWWQWMETYLPAASIPSPDGSNSRIGTSSGINFAAFDQGVMSAGGNVSISAGRDISEFSVSLPTTWYLSDIDAYQSGDAALPTVNIVGGGNLSVTAGRDILSGTYFVSKGVGDITAGGRIGSAFTYSQTYYTGISVSDDVAPLLALQDATLNVSARQTVEIGKVYNPSWFTRPTSTNPANNITADSQSYSADSAVNVVSTGGDVLFGTLRNLNMTGSPSGLLMPATLDLTALSGSIAFDGSAELYPSATGQLSVIADGTIDFYDNTVNGGNHHSEVGLIDYPASILPSILHPLLPYGSSITDYLAPGSSTYRYLKADHLHANDPDPVRIYSLNGDVVDGLTDPRLGHAMDGVVLYADKPAQIYAGGDVVNLWFLGQNLYDSDVTRIAAAGSIYDQPFGTTSTGNTGAPGQDYPFLPVIEIAGPGTLLVEAGGDLGHFVSVSDIVRVGYLNYYSLGSYNTGILAVGDANSANLPHDSADIDLLFGVGPGIATADFAAAYLDPAVSLTDLPSFSADLVSFMQSYDNDQWKRDGKPGTAPVLTADEAWAEFQALPEWRQVLLDQQVLFDILQTVGHDYNDPDSAYFHQYARGYTALNTLFPASLGYTQNALNGGTNGSNSPVTTGNLDMRSATVQTQEGGNISILGPGGSILVGSTAAPPYFTDSNGRTVAGPNQMGILTLEQGNIDIFSDQSLLLAQSRVFTEQGGAITMWSSNGDINAGKGTKTSSETPRPTYICDPDGYCRVDPKGQVTGAGIGSLQTIPGASTGDVELIAPRGTVDAGEAGIRVSGDIYVAAVAVANADNIEVRGKSFGLPPQPVTDLNLTVASDASKDAASIVDNMASHQPRTTVDVEITGFGGDFDNPQECVPSSTNNCTQ